MNLIELINHITDLALNIKAYSPRALSYVAIFVFSCFIVSILKKIKQLTGFATCAALAALIAIYFLPKLNLFNIEEVLSQPETVQIVDYVSDIDL